MVKFSLSPQRRNKAATPQNVLRWSPAGKPAAPEMPRPVRGPERFGESPGLYPRNRFAISGDDIPPTPSLKHSHRAPGPQKSQSEFGDLSPGHAPHVTGPRPGPHGGVDDLTIIVREGRIPPRTVIQYAPCRSAVAHDAVSKTPKSSLPLGLSPGRMALSVGGYLGGIVAPRGDRRVAR